MILKLKYDPKKQEKFHGIFVEDTDMNVWLKSAIHFESPAKVKVYAIPGLTANSVIGALLLGNLNPELESKSLTQVYGIGELLYLLEGSSTSPLLHDSNVSLRFQSPHFYHPSYGLIELQEITDWKPFLSINEEKIKIEIPKEGIQIIDGINDYYLREILPEKAIENLLKSTVPNRSQAPEKPLNLIEKLKLQSLKMLLGKDKKGKKVERVLKLFGGNSKLSSWWNKKLQNLAKEFENLEERNKRELDKLMDMLKNDPDLALQYAIPIDSSGLGRGSEMAFRLQQRWSGGRSIFGNSGAGGYVNFQDEQTEKLRLKYQSMAQAYINQNNWEKAAFVYLELLSNPHMAALTLENGKRYESAASIYLSKCKDLKAAARCYENGKLYKKAIELYEELNQQEKVGDIYTLIGNKKAGIAAYRKEQQRQLELKSYKKAARIASEKLKDIPLAQKHWLAGWELDYKESKDCLDEFLSSFDLSQRKQEINKLHTREYEGRKMHTVLEVLFKQSKKEELLKPELKKIIYESVARTAQSDPDIVDYIKKWKRNPLVSKDAIRFKQFKRSRG